MFKACILVGFLFLAPSVLHPQDPVKADPSRYKVEFENAQVRVLRVRYGPHDKSVMHELPARVVVYLTDQKAKFTLANGKTVERDSKAGEVRWLPAQKHLLENLSDKPLELVLVEVKSRRATTNTQEPK